MSNNPVNSVDWTLLIGYNKQEAEEILQEENAAYEVTMIAPPNKKLVLDDVRVIAVQSQDKVRLICASTDWSVS